MCSEIHNRETRLRQLLESRFAPSCLEIIDDSARHAGHIAKHHGEVGPGETHYIILLVSSCFEGVSRVARSRLVHDALAGEFATGMHALSLTLRTPEEHAKAES